MMRANLISHELVHRVFQQYGVFATFRPLSTLRKRLVAPKDPTEKEDQTGVVYHIPCSDCSSVYIGETGRKLKLRLKEHKSIAPSATSQVSAMQSPVIVSTGTQSRSWKRTAGTIRERSGRQFTSGGTRTPKSIPPGGMSYLQCITACLDQ